jgi:DDE superfamily endonuclease
LFALTGEQKRDPLKDAYNFYLSQLRIRIEMTFGMLTTKWRIFRRPLQVSVANAGGKIFLAFARLHNFIIDFEGGVPSTVGQQGGVATTEIGIDDDGDDDNDVRGFLPSDIGMTAIPGNSIMRDILMERISAMALVRPMYNIERNNNARTRNEQD